MIPALKWAAIWVIFNVSFIVPGKVTRQCPQITMFEEKGDEPKRGVEPASFRRLEAEHLITG